MWCTAEERRGGRGGGGQVKGVPEGRGRVVLGSFYVPGYALPLTFDQGTAIRGFVEALSGMGSVVGPNTVMKWVRRI